MVRRDSSEENVCANPRNSGHLISKRLRVRSWVRVAVFSVSTLANLAAMFVLVFSHTSKLEWRREWGDVEAADYYRVVIGVVNGSVRAYVSMRPPEYLKGIGWSMGDNVFFSEPSWNNLGIHAFNVLGFYHRGMLFPLWIPAVLCPICSFLVIRKPFREWRRREHGRCETCGYDLTGNVSGTCSECGTRVG